MKYIANTQDFSVEGKSVITLGKFDGLHRGHQKLIRRVKDAAGDANAVVFTFDVSPVSVVTHRASGGLLTNEERKDMLVRAGIDFLIECPFTQEIMQMPPEKFVKEYLVSRLHAKRIIVGPDFHFGFQRKGTPQMLQAMGRQYGFDVEVLEKELESGREISSTWVKEELAAGNMEMVEKLLGYPYFVHGSVVHGRGLGRTIGVPTINQIPQQQKLLPPRGVYASQTKICGTRYCGISNIGMKPTVGGEFLGVETYLFDCCRDLYGKDARVYLYRYQRPEQKFSSLEKLREQLAADERQGRDFFDTAGQNTEIPL